MATITVFVGSVRVGRQGRKVADFVAKQLQNNGHTVHVVDPSEHNLPLMEQMVKSKKEPSDDVKEVQSWVAASDGYVAVTPEYNHSFSGVLKNTIDYFLDEYLSKPWAIVSYSAGGLGGVRAGEHFRQVVSEFGYSVTINLMISKVQDVFDEQGNPKEEHSYVNKNCAKMIKEFEWLIEALNTQREKAGMPY